MPSVPCGWSDDRNVSGSALLMQYGPTLFVQVGFDPNYRLGDQGRPDIPDQLYPALVDTGAGESCIDSALAQTLGLPIVDRAPRSGVNGPQEFNIHLAQIYVPDLHWTILGQFAGVHLIAGQQPHYALIGRTFLTHCTLTYEGRTGSVVISTD